MTTTEIPDGAGSKALLQAPYRCAIYFAPAVDDPWWVAGSQWVGRCANARAPLAQPPVPGVDPALVKAVTADPRRYGWHATLKAPFQLAAGLTLDDVRAALQRVCADFSRFTLPPLEARPMDRFLALRPSQPSAALEAIAAACVTRLHPLAAPLSEAELARRRRAQLTPNQDALLQQWGYPWVLDHYRFHFSLTGDLTEVAPEAREALLLEAGRRFASLPPCEFSHLSVFVEPERGGDFVLVEQVELAA